MVPGEWRKSPEQDVVVGRHLPPSSDRVPDFMRYFYRRFAFNPPPGAVLTAVGSGKGKRILAMATAHHRFNWIHPFPDGNGRVSRLMSHAMAQAAGIGAHGLWSVSRGLARGLAPGADGRLEYKQHMAWADEGRQGDRDGTGNLSLKGLEIFTTWFLKACLDQISYMSDLFELGTLADRIERHIALNERLPPESNWLLQEALRRGEFERGEAERITRLPERSARRILKELTEIGLLASDTPKGPVSLRFPADTLDTLFPRLYG
jgi:Fic family protein